MCTPILKTTLTGKTTSCPLRDEVVLPIQLYTPTNLHFTLASKDISLYIHDLTND